MSKYIFECLYDALVMRNVGFMEFWDLITVDFAFYDRISDALRKKALRKFFMREVGTQMSIICVCDLGQKFLRENFGVRLTDLLREIRERCLLKEREYTRRGFTSRGRKSISWRRRSRSAEKRKSNHDDVQNANYGGNRPSPLIIKKSSGGDQLSLRPSQSEKSDNKKDNKDENRTSNCPENSNCRGPEQQDHNHNQHPNKSNSRGRKHHRGSRERERHSKHHKEKKSSEERYEKNGQSHKHKHHKHKHHSKNGKRKHKKHHKKKHGKKAHSKSKHRHHHKSRESSAHSQVEDGELTSNDRSAEMKEESHSPKKG